MLVVPGLEPLERWAEVRAGGGLEESEDALDVRDVGLRLLEMDLHPADELLVLDLLPQSGEDVEGQSPFDEEQVGEQLQKEVARLVHLAHRGVRLPCAARGQNSGGRLG